MMTKIGIYSLNKIIRIYNRVKVRDTVEDWEYASDRILHIHRYQLNPELDSMGIGLSVDELEDENDEQIIKKFMCRLSFLINKMIAYDDLESKDVAEIAP